MPASNTISKEMKELEGDLFEIKETISDGIYLKLMNLLQGKLLFPDVTNAKLVKIVVDVYTSDFEDDNDTNCVNSVKSIGIFEVINNGLGLLIGRNGMPHLFRHNNCEISSRFLDILIKKATNNQYFRESNESILKLQSVEVLG